MDKKENLFNSLFGPLKKLRKVENEQFGYCMFCLNTNGDYHNSDCKLWERFLTGTVL